MSKSYISLVVSSLDTEMLIGRLVDLDVDPAEYKVVRGKNDVCHVTLAYPADFPSEEVYDQFVKENYSSTIGDKYQIKVTGYARDQYCVAMTVDVGDLQFYPEIKILHLTMMLKDRQPVYSNELLKRLTKKDPDSIVKFDPPIEISGILTLNRMIVPPVKRNEREEKIKEQIREIEKKLAELLIRETFIAKKEAEISKREEEVTLREQILETKQDISKLREPTTSE